MILHMWRMTDGLVFFTVEKRVAPFFEGAQYLGMVRLAVEPPKPPRYRLT